MRVVVLVLLSRKSLEKVRGSEQALASFCTSPSAGTAVPLSATTPSCPLQQPAHVLPSLLVYGIPRSVRARILSLSVFKDLLMLFIVGLFSVH